MPGRKRPTNLFVPRVRHNKLGVEFQKLLNSELHATVRERMQAAFEDMGDADGNFVEQFQTTGFSSRLWELYLHQVLQECGFRPERESGGVDFVVRGLWDKFALEAVTSNPSRKAEKPGRMEAGSGLDEMLPIRLAGPLTKKLGKRYWDRESVAGLPLVLAVAPFFDEQALQYTFADLERYLYGIHASPGELTPHGYRAVFERVDVHKMGKKQIASKFFGLPHAEYVSAVAFSNSGTLGKFSRMTVQGNPIRDVDLIRFGLCADPAPHALKPLEFEYRVGACSFVESWTHGLHVFHNPLAVRPLPFGTFGGDAYEVFYEDGQRWEHRPDFHVFNSKTVWKWGTGDPADPLQTG